MNIKTYLKIEENYVLQCCLIVEPFQDQHSQASITWFDINYWKAIECFLKPLLKQCLNHLKENDVIVTFFGTTPYDIDDVSIQLKYELKERSKQQNSVVQPKLHSKMQEAVEIEDNKECHNHGDLFETLITLDYILYINIKKLETIQREVKEETDVKCKETSSYFQNENDFTSSTLKSSLPQMKYKKSDNSLKFENKFNSSNCKENKEHKLDQYLTSLNYQSERDVEDKVKTETLSPTRSKCLQINKCSKPKPKRERKTKLSKEVLKNDLKKYFNKNFKNSEIPKTNEETNNNFSSSTDLKETSAKSTNVRYNDSLKENLNVNLTRSKRKLQNNDKFEDESGLKKCEDLNDFKEKTRENKRLKIVKRRKVTSLENSPYINDILNQTDTSEENNAEKNSDNDTSEQELSNDQLAKLTKLFNDIVSRNTPIKDRESSSSSSSEAVPLNESYCNNNELSFEEKPVKKCKWLGKVKESDLRNIVKRNLSRLKNITSGKVYSRRHQDYTRGGRAKIALTFQVHLSQFTEKQIDYIMDILIPKFYKGNYEDMDYILKVLLPEMLIIVHMELNGTTHKESDRLMSEAMFKVCNSE